MLKDNTFYLRYLPAEPASADTITESDVEAGTFELLHTTTEDLVTKLVARWRATGAQQEGNKVILRHNVKKYGTKEREFDFDYWRDLVTGFLSGAAAVDGLLVRYEELADGRFETIERYLGFALSKRAAEVRPSDGPPPLELIPPAELEALEHEVGELAASLDYRYELGRDHR